MNHLLAAAFSNSPINEMPLEVRPAHKQSWNKPFVLMFRISCKEK